MVISQSSGFIGQNDLETVGVFSGCLVRHLDVQGIRPLLIVHSRSVSNQGNGSDLLAGKVCAAQGPNYSFSGGGPCQLDRIHTVSFAGETKVVFREGRRSSVVERAFDDFRRTLPIQLPRAGAINCFTIYL
jgi:hypothetical protein